MSSVFHGLLQFVVRPFRYERFSSVCFPCIQQFERISKGTFRVRDHNLYPDSTVKFLLTDTLLSRQLYFMYRRLFKISFELPQTKTIPVPSVHLWTLFWHPKLQLLFELCSSSASLRYLFSVTVQVKDCWKCLMPSFHMLTMFWWVSQNQYYK